MFFQARPLVLAALAALLGSCGGEDKSQRPKLVMPQPPDEAALKTLPTKLTRPPELDTLFGGERGLDHVAIVTSSLEDTKKNFVDKLGFSTNTVDGELGGGQKNSVFYFRDSSYLELLTTNEQWRPKMVEFIKKHGQGTYFWVAVVFSAGQLSQFLVPRGFPLNPPAPGKQDVMGGEQTADLAQWWTLTFKDSPLPGGNETFFFIAYNPKIRKFVREIQPKQKEYIEKTAHPNGVVGLRATWLVVADLAAATAAFEKVGFSKGKAYDVAALDAKGQEIGAGEGSLLLLQGNKKGVADKFLKTHGEGAIIGLGLETTDLAAAQALAEKGTGLKMQRYAGLRGEAILVPAEHAANTWLEFYQAPPAPEVSTHSAATAAPDAPKPDEPKPAAP